MRQWPCLQVAFAIAAVFLSTAAASKDSPKAAVEALKAGPPPAAPVQIGHASYYGASAGTTTAAGKPLPRHKLTAASKTLPIGTKAKVVNLKNGRAVDVTVVDRGPYAKHRILDVSPKAAARLGMKRKGVAPVAVKPIRLPRRSGG